VVPAGTEETAFGNGIILKVTMTWAGGTAALYLNDTLVQQFSYATPTPNWSTTSNLALGAYEDLTSGGSSGCDDIIDELTVTGSATPQSSPISSASTALTSEIEASISPALTRLQNGADEAAPAVCSPAAIGSLVGQFLPDGATPVTDRSGHATSLAGVRVLINGSYAPVLSASSSRVDFLCPAVPPSTSLGIAVETAAGLSNRVETTVEESSPGIFSTAWPAPESAATLSIRATGIDWLGKVPTVQPSVRIGERHIPIDSITPDPQEPGVSTLTVTLPSDLSGDSVPVVIEVMQTDGRTVTSNPAMLPLDARPATASRPPIAQ
jgi:hypothetical protein